MSESVKARIARRFAKALDIGARRSTTRWLRLGRGGRGFVVVTYHRILEERDPLYWYDLTLEEFEEQLEGVRRACSVLSLDEIFSRLDRGLPLPPRTVALTFDDGYRDTATVAWPLLREHGLPATVFVTVGAIERGALWPDFVKYAIGATEKDRLQMEALANGAGPRTFDLATGEQRLRAVQRLESTLKRMSDELKERALDEMLERLLGTDRASAEIPRLMMSWDELSEVAREGLAVGGHTLTHPILTRIPESRAREEIGGSRRELEERLEQPVRHFAYPNGRRSDVSPHVREMVEMEGFASAFTTLVGVNPPGADRYALRRLDSGQPAWKELCRSWA